MYTTSTTRNTPTREAILEAAARAFIEGESSVRLSDIAKRAGVSRQSVYVHFGSRTGLLVAMVQHLDEKGHVWGHIEELRRAPTGLDALDLALRAPPEYYPVLYPIAKLFMASRYEDEAMAVAWEDRMRVRREICALLIQRLREDGVLSPAWEPEAAIDMLWTLTSWEVWERLVIDRGWPKERYVRYLRTAARRTLTDCRE